MRQTPSVNLSSGAPQPPGRTPQRSALRPGGETLLARGTPPEPPMGLPRCNVRASGTTKARCLPARLRRDVPRGRQ
jgi:hypothetical protein